MNARLSSLLVAGCVFLAGAHVKAVSDPESAGKNTLQGVAVQPDAGAGAVVTLSIPGFAGEPRIEVLRGPDRVVLDLPGVHRGSVVSLKTVKSLTHPLIRRSRIAQFTTSPVPVTRVVFEVAPGTQASVAAAGDGLRVSLTPGTGRVVAQAAVPPPPALPAAPPAVVAAEKAPAPVVAPQVAKAAPVSAIPAVGGSFQALPSLAVSSLLPATPGLRAQEAQPAPRTEASRAGRVLGEAPQRYTGSRMTIDVKGTDIQDFLRIIAEHAKLNLVADQDVQGIYTFRFVDTPWDQVLDVILKHAALGKEVSNGVIRVAKIEKLQKEEEDRKKLDEAKALAGDLTSITRPLSFAKVAEAKPVVEKILSKRGSLIIDERTNTMIISDLPRYIPLVEDLLATLDVQIQQVQIEARVIEATRGYEQAFGVNFPQSNSGSKSLKLTQMDPVSGALKEVDAPWGFGRSWNSGQGFTRTASGQSAGTAWGTNTTLTSPSGEFWVSFLSQHFSVNAILQAAEKDGKVKIVSNPKIVTQNNKKAKILSGEKIPYPSQQGGAAGGAITVAFVEANLELNVTPQITNDGTIIMDLQIEKSEADFSRTVLGSPTIVRKAIDTQVLVKDGGTAILGGVYTTNNTKEYNGIPFLGRIPVLGWLFRSKSDQEKTAELLIFITPRILKS